MKYVILTSLLFSAYAQAKCTVRTYVDPQYSKQVKTAVNKTLKKKGYKLLSFSTPDFEKYRLNVTLPGINPQGDITESVHVYLEVFTSPNFEVMHDYWEATEGMDKNKMALEFLKTIPACEG